MDFYVWVTKQFKFSRMKKLVIFLLFINLLNSRAQEKSNLTFGTFFGYFGMGKTLSQETRTNDFNIGVNTTLRKGWGLGLDVSQSSYLPSGAQGLPNPESIENLSQSSIPDGTEVVFSTEDDNRFISFSPNVIKVINLGEKNLFSLFFQAGPSVIYSKTINYRVSYSDGSFGGFNFPGSNRPKLVYDIDRQDYQYLLGAFSRVATRINFTRSLGLEFSVNSNINSQKSIVGVGIGLAWGIAN